MNVIEVVDVPPGTSEAVAREMFNRPCSENRYLLIQVLPMADGTQRGIYRLLAKAYDKSPEQRLQANRDGKEEAAHAIIQANSGMTVRALMGELAKAGITRRRTWITEARLDLRRARSKQTE
jgi:hypothetical protein